MKRFGWAAAALTLLTAFCLGACGDNKGGNGAGNNGAGSNGSGDKDGGTLVYARGADTQYLDPARVTDGESVKVLTNIFETLVAFKPGSLETQPGLAESWTVSDDGTVWTFKLRQATFHDGTPFNADAVLFSFRRQFDDKHPHHTTDMSYWGSIFKAIVKDIRKTDDATVVIELSSPFAPFEATMTLFSMGIVAPSGFAADAKPFESNPIGTGPFKFSRWSKDEVIVLERFDDYWGAKAGVQKVMFRVVPENSQRVIQLENGQADIADNINPQDHDRVKAHKDLELVQVPGLNMGYLSMNNLQKPFDDVRVRQAVALAISKEKIRQGAYDGHGDLATVPAPPGLPYRAQIEDRKQDLVAAKKLLAEAGLADGFATELWYGSNARPYMPSPESVAIQVQQDLAQIGITLKTSKIEWNQYLGDVQNGRHAMCLLGWSADYGDIDNFLYVLLSKDGATLGSANNVSFYTDAKTSQLLTSARSVNDAEKREALYQEAQQRIFDQVPMIPFIHMPDTRAVSKRVKGYVLYAAGGEYLHHCKVD